VELRETAGSWVFLAGERAYKVRKPVGTLARRRACCAEAMGVNRRLAPSIYAGVVALVPRGPDGLAVAGEHDPRALEYAVEMRRYDEHATLAAMLADGRATKTSVAAVGGALARFHAGVAPEVPDDGTDRLIEAIEESLASLARAAVGVVDPAQLAALARFVRAGVAGLGPQLREREAAGLVRDGHGDLRAERVVFDRPLEFVGAVDLEPARRRTDVANDLALLVMDVARHDEALARALVRGYAATGGPAGDQRLLDFLVVTRALARATAEPERIPELVALAERFAWRARLPRVVCVAGLTASGKTTLAAALGDASALPVVSSDFVRRARADLESAERAGRAQYAREVSREVYAWLGSAAARAVQSDGGAIVDATFRHPDDVAAFQSASRAAAAAGWIVCHAPAEVLLDRARWRDADPALVATQIARSGGRLPLPCAPLAELETVRAVPRLLDTLAATLDARLALGPTPEPEPRT
jgi:aminoglycoside phosphotransferase family enzyme/predicted kinase